jgi:carbon-monoxide dehydrogenase small subunit
MKKCHPRTEPAFLLLRRRVPWTVMPVGKRICTLRVNGEAREVAVEGTATLLEVLRYELGLTGSKQGCDEGDCGACTVLIDGRPALACLSLAVTLEGREITTIEGLAGPKGLHPVQDAFDEHGAAQCGFCTPGMIMSAKALLDRNPEASTDEVRSALAGNLCRCTGYVKIIDAVRAAGARMKREQAEPAAPAAPAAPADGAA